MSALYSYGIAASPQVLLPTSLLNDMAFLTSISNRICIFRTPTTAQRAFDAFILLRFVELLPFSLQA
jgi:hypothetical protein